MKQSVAIWDKLKGISVGYFKEIYEVKSCNLTFDLFPLHPFYYPAYRRIMETQMIHNLLHRITKRDCPSPQESPYIFLKKDDPPSYISD